MYFYDIFLTEMLTSVMPQTALGRVVLRCILSHTNINIISVTIMTFVNQ